MFTWEVRPTRGTAVFGVAIVLVVFGAAACFGGGGSDDAATGDVEADTAGADTDTPRRGGSDADASSTCEDPPNCGAGERVVGCERCVSEENRVCETDRDCRPEETCEEFEHAEVCIYEPGPVRTCPGSEGCESGSSGPLKAAAASRVVTPQGFERPKSAGVDENNYLNFPASRAPEDKWHDCGYDGLCPGDEAYVEADEGEGDGELQGIWIAGFSPGRPAQYCPDERVGCSDVDCCDSKYAHDDLRVQVAVLHRGDTTVAFAALDTVGWFHTDVEEIRDRLPGELGVDLLVMAGTHNHEAPDTAGQWGPGSSLPSRSGRNPRFLERVYSQTVDGIASAVEALQPAEAEAAVVDRGIEGMAMGDSRPPYVFDDNIPVLRLTARDSGDPIATLLSVGNHPEVLWSDNPYLTSDYPHYVRKYVRDGLEPVRDGSGNVVKPELEGFGGVTLFFAGALGGLINPGDGGGLDYAGESPEADDSFDAADAVGQQVAERVLSAHANGDFEAITEPRLAFAHKEFLAPIRNERFQLAAFQLEVLERDIYNVAELGPVQFAPGPPKVLTEVQVVRLGDVTFFTAPGEVFPETLVGGFPRKSTAQDPVVGDVREATVPAECGADGLPVENGSGSEPCIVAPDQTNPPDWSEAPEPPYVYDQVPGEKPFFIGLGGDFVGYMVPTYDYEFDGYSEEAPGSHYEETNGLGRAIIERWASNLDRAAGAVE